MSDTQGDELIKLASVTARQWSPQQWDGFWKLVAEVSARDAEEILISHLTSGATLKVKCADGRWHDVGTVVASGLVEPKDRGLVVDRAYHEPHELLLKALGVSARPVESVVMTQDLTFLEYQRLQRDAYLRDQPPRGRPPAAALIFRESTPIGPLHVLRRFVDTGDVAATETWTSELLAAKAFEHWHLVNTRNRTSEPRALPAPHLWAVQRYGLLRSSWARARPAPAYNQAWTECRPCFR